MLERILPFFVGLALLLGSGCARSDDGTVIIPRPLDARRFFDKEPPHLQQPHIETSVFPVAPQDPEGLEPRRAASHKTSTRRASRIASPPLSSYEPHKVLVCKNVSEPGKRYRMVCE
ncbi:MAG: hypothetical protein EOS73_31950 [Mesorhizobium sp.]|uniref:hypothetical protein n=1 Tax=Mesorhizobium sp. M7A.F.Ca.ET.027.02.1.1 TaxID=2496655 RepID=UPI000FD400C1|nr:hypothetical protein [Mesorhizobium sp. M7A.F.Ca.ET.027.02.1.1]RVD07942.1 hypothetical protein EN749_34150 [Mesorhizobium sp. M7A.F.Ca.ET.027.02.1.1]RWC25282.1 MAG: hypothetical protein EOS27_28980 [Mesorhizobium sp.]RWC98101.1 MAG: hypothetical protein EOS73_31950 [Mesorhizobium sp.]